MECKMSKASVLLAIMEALLLRITRPHLTFATGLQHAAHSLDICGSLSGS